MNFDIGKLREMQKVAKNPTDSEHVQALATVLVELEFLQLEAVEDLHDAQEIDGVDVQATREERRDALLALADAIANGELRSYWFENAIGEHIENYEDAEPYAALDPDGDDWQDQIESWAELYRSKAPGEFETYSDREIAAQHIESTFGVSLDRFESEVVGYSRKDVLQTALASNFEHVVTGIRASEAVVRDGEE